MMASPEDMPDVPVNENGGDGFEATLARLMRRARAGDSFAYGELLKKVAGMIRGSLRAKSSGAMAAQVEDIVQEVLLAVHMKRHTYDVEQPFLPWLRAIARYKWIDALRRQGAHQQVSYEDLLLTEDIALAAAETDPTSQLDLDKLLGRLPDKQSSVIRLVKLKGLSVQEAAKESGQSLSAVKVNIHRGIKALAAFVAIAPKGGKNP